MVSLPDIQRQQEQYPRMKKILSWTLLIVAREDDAEYVECLDCGEVFDSGEFRDMAIEEMQDQQEESA